MKKSLKHIIILIAFMAMALASVGQRTRYVQVNSIHALSVPEHDGYSFEWSIVYGINFNRSIPVNTTSNVTQNIVWDQLTTYRVTVIPKLDSVGCYGEPVTIDVVAVQFLSLHTFDDIYFTDINMPVSGNVAENDFDETGANIYYNPNPVFLPQNGTVKILPDGSFTYTPFDGFVGTDQFVYEAFNDHDRPMYSNSTVTIVVQDNSQVADLHIEKTGPQKALLGSNIGYTITVKNLGPHIARNVVVVDTLAFGLFTPTYSIGNEVQTWSGELNVGDMASGDSLIIYIFADISIYSPNWLYNQAVTWSDTYDPYHPDNSSIWATEVSAIYVDLKDSYYLPSCETREIDASAESNNEVQSYQWIPATGLSDPTIPNPIFTPDESTIGNTTQYILFITDSRGNVASDTTNIIVAPEPKAIISGDTLFKDIDENIMVFGSESFGIGLQFFWWSNHGGIIGYQNRDSIEVDTTGWYYMRVTDELGCDNIDSVLILLESHPPVTQSDSIAIVAGSSVVLPNFGANYLALTNTPELQLEYLELLPDSVVNVLINDSDRNNFDIRLTQVLTHPNHSTFSITSDGYIVINTNRDYWGIDSLEYVVCNNGYPEKCSSEWLYITSLREPLNANLVIEKTGDAIAFWGDTIHYSLEVYNLGPDTVNNTTITDILNIELWNAQYSIDSGLSWLDWNDYLVYDKPIRPNQDTLVVNIRANIRSTAERFIENMAYIETNIIENRLEDDTSWVNTKIKEKVEAIAGNDTILGFCRENLQLDASLSTGENITYRWQPAGYLSNANIANPVFTNPGFSGSYNYILTVTDDDGITDTDTIKITVLLQPTANAGPDRLQQEDRLVLLDGTKSKGEKISYFWTSIDGNIDTRFEFSQSATADTTGTYTLTVTDVAGCQSSDQMVVFNFMYKPFAIPDYYSINVTTENTIEGNLLYNDLDPNSPNDNSNLMAIAGTYNTELGGTVVIKDNGDFIYTRPQGGKMGAIDDFNYEVYSLLTPLNHPNRKAKGYVRITINRNSTIANLNIVKTPQTKKVLIGEDIEFLLSVENLGNVVARDVWLTDTLSEYTSDPWYKDGANSWKRYWPGGLKIGDINVGETREVRVKATVNSNAPKLIFNAATVASPTFDNMFDWDDVSTRNVDTASVLIEYEIIARAELVEDWPADNNHNDSEIGPCDNMSYLTAEKSVSKQPIDRYEWSPSNLVTSPYEKTTGFTHALYDTTVTFSLIVASGELVDVSFVEVTFSPEVVADAGPDRKMNPGDPLIIDATNSRGAEASYRWFKGSVEHTAFDNGNVLRPIVSEPGVYVLTVTDKHGCTKTDEVSIKENDVYAVTDIMVMLVNDTLRANVSINDYDPEGDSIYYPGVVLSQPNNGIILPNPSNQIGVDGSFIYVPNANFVGSDKFTYRLCDDNNPDLCVSGTVMINVLDVIYPNTPPVANADYFFVNRLENIYSNVLANDFDLDGDKITLSRIVQQPTKGTLSSNPNGDIIYIPTLTEKGVDKFIYEICDQGSPQECSSAEVTIYYHKIDDENQHPVAVDDAYFAVEKPIKGNVLTNDYDPNGNDFRINTKPIIEPLNGTIEFFADGSFEYIPKVGFEGTEQIVYQICESRTEDQYCDYATLYILNVSPSRYSTDVAIVKTKTDNENFVISGTQIEYALTVTIDGPTLANDVEIIDTLNSQLLNVEYSFDQVAWSAWNGSVVIEQMMLKEELTIYIRADVPVIFDGNILNVGWVDHAMDETNPINNRSELFTEVYQKLIADAGENVIIGSCQVPYQLDATASIGVSDMQYRWSPADLLDDPNSATPLYNGEPGTKQNFMLVIFSEIHPQIENDTAYVTVTIEREPVADAGADQWPESTEPVTIDGSGSTGVGPLEYMWWKYDAQGNVEVVANTVDVQVIRSADYFLTITDRYGCENTDMVHVGYPVDEFDAIDDFMPDSCVITWQQEPVDIYVLRNDLIDDEDEYNLDLLYVVDYPRHGEIVPSPYDSMFTYIPEMYYFGPDTFTYVVSTRFFNDQATVCIEVLPQLPFVPEGFSPNGDGKNDFLLIENIELYESNNIVIFNRWGDIVFKKDGYSNDEPWDGVANKGLRIGNGAVPTGVYFYIIDLGDDRIPAKYRYPTGNIYIATDNRR